MYNLAPIMKHEALLEGRMNETFQKVDRREDPLPICIEIHPTDFCNQGCLYCFGAGQGREGIETRQRGKYMSLGDYSSLFQEMAFNNIRDLSVSGGGEPLLSTDIDGIYSSALDNGLRVRTVTNGNTLNQSSLELVLLTQEVRFSVDTPNPITYSKLRRVNPRLHAKTLDNITRLVQAKNSGGFALEIGTTCIIGEENAEELEEFADIMIGQIGVDHVIYKSDIYGNIKPDSEEATLVNQQLARAQEKYGDKIDYRPDLGGFEPGKPCAVPYFKAVLNSYGELYSCCLGAQPGERNGYKFGDVKAEIRNGNTDALVTVWEQTSDIRSKMLKKVGCMNCNFTDRKINNAYFVS